MGLRSQMYHPLYLKFLKNLSQLVRIFNITFYKMVIFSVLNIFQVFQIASIGEFIEVDNSVLWVIIDQSPDQVRPNESGTAGN